MGASTRSDLVQEAVNGRGRNGKAEQVAEKASEGSAFPVRQGGSLIYHVFMYQACINTDVMKSQEGGKERK